MEKTVKETKSQINEILKQLQNEQEEIESCVKRILKEEENEMIEIRKSYAELADLEKQCTGADKKLRRLILEKQSMLKTLEKKKLDFNSEFQREIKIQKDKIEEELKWQKRMNNN